MRHYGLGTPIDWGDDVSDELWRQNRLWNTLVEIERDNRDGYSALIDGAPAVAEIAAQIKPLEEERSALLEARAQRRAKARAKTSADVPSDERRLTEIRKELAPLYAQRKAKSAQARKERADELTALEAQRKAYVKTARQHSGCWWCNYNAVLDSYAAARSKAIKEGARLNFHRFGGRGRLTNQIIGGVSVEDMLAGRHSQVSIRISQEKARRHNRGRVNGWLTVTAFTGRDAEGKHFRRNVTFPIYLHRPLPPWAQIKVVTVNIPGRDDVRRPTVTFTLRGSAGERAGMGMESAGVNLGWKQVSGGLRVATVQYGAGSAEHLLLPDEWLAKLDRLERIQGELDDSASRMQAKILDAIADWPAWSEGVSLDGVPEWVHRDLTSLRRAKRANIHRLVPLALRILLHCEEHPEDIKALHPLIDDIRAWRNVNGRKLKALKHGRDKTANHRKYLYLNVAARLAERCDIVALDGTSLKEAAILVTEAGDENPLHQEARTNRVRASTYELRLAMQQAMAKRKGRLIAHKGKINQCSACSSTNLNGDSLDLIRSCNSCGAVFDIDENAARNLLAAAECERSSGEQDAV